MSGNASIRVLAAATLAASLLPLVAQANKVVTGTSLPVQGTLLSAYADTSVGGLLYSVPGRTVALFTLTQACVTPNGNAQVEGNTIGRIYQRNDGDTLPSALCVNFSPGLAIPPGERLQCAQVNGGPGSCIISGIKSPPPPP